jgi:hypothetical protein
MNSIGDHKINATRRQAWILHSVTIVNAYRDVNFNCLYSLLRAKTDSSSVALSHIDQLYPQSHSGLCALRMNMLKACAKYVKYGLKIKRGIGSESAAQTWIIVSRSTLWVAQNVIGHLYLLKGFGVTTTVRMMLAGQLAVGTFNSIRVGVAINT